MMTPNRLPRQFTRHAARRLGGTYILGHLYAGGTQTRFTSSIRALGRAGRRNIDMERR
jgi:hypothetical protein